MIESGVLAGLLEWPESAEDVWSAGIVPDHFSGRLRVPADALYRIWQEHRTGDATSLVLMLTELGELRRFSATDVFSLVQESSNLSRDSHRLLIARLEEQRQRRKAIELATRIMQVAGDESSDFHVQTSDLAAEISTAVQTRITNPMVGAVTVGELLSGDYPAPGWAVEGLLRSRTRAVITGPEGFGKSELLYQIAVGAALGIHPFHESPIASAKVMVVDAENETGDLQGRIKRIYGGYRHEGRSPNMVIQPALGWNLLNPQDAGHLFSMVRTYMPDLLIIGPVYQICDGDQNDAEVIRRFMRVIDECRRISDCAVMTEAHANNGFNGVRDWRPSGSSLWRRWPEFGIGLDPVQGMGNKALDLLRWRGDRVASNWPERITRGKRLPWDGTDVIGV